MLGECRLEARADQMGDKWDQLLDLDIGAGTALRILKVGYAIGDRLGHVVDERRERNRWERASRRRPNRDYGCIGPGSFRYDDF